MRDSLRTKHRAGSLARAVGYLVASGALAIVITGYTPHPPISAAGSDLLIHLNRLLRAAGPAALAAIAAMALVCGVARAASSRVAEMLALTSPPSNSENRSLARLTLAPLLIATVAMGTSLGVEAGRGAREPIEGVLASSHVSIARISVVVGSASAKPFNRSVVSNQDAATIERWASDSGVRTIPFHLALGDAHSSEQPNPSSTAIIALPSDVLPGLDSQVGEVLQVVTTRQFARVGESITVEGRRAVVSRVIDWFPGLDRTAVLMTELSYDRLSDVNEPYTGVFVLGTPIGMRPATNAPVAWMPVDRWLSAYDRFWERSVSPLSMEFLLAIALVGAVAASYMRTGDVLRRRREIAVQHILGVSRATLIRAEFLRTFVDVAVATVWSAIPTLGLIYVTNSSQYGVAVEASARGLGAGALLILLATLASTVTAAAAIKRMDSAYETR